MYFRSRQKLKNGQILKKVAKIFFRNLVMWVLYQDAPRSLIECKKNEYISMSLGWENVQKLSKIGTFHKLQFLDSFWTFSQLQDIEMH